MGVPLECLNEDWKDDTLLLCANLAGGVTKLIIIRVDNRTVLRRFCLRRGSGTGDFRFLDAPVFGQR